MHKFDDRPCVGMDVDNTLIWWNDKDGYPTVDITVGEHTHTYSIHKENVDRIKQHAIRGHQVVVWSKGGMQWANAVVDALDLRKYIVTVMPKFDWIYDDSDPNDFLPENLYIKVEDNNDTT